MQVIAYGLWGRRCESHGHGRTLLRKIRNIPVEAVELGEQRGQCVACLMVPFAFTYMIFPGIVGVGHPTTSSIIEVLLSAISPVQRMAAKVFRADILMYGKRRGPAKSSAGRESDSVTLDARIDRPIPGGR